MRANKELDEDEFRRKKTVSQNEKARLFARIEATDKRMDRWLEVAEQGVNFAETARARFADDTSKVLRVRREIFAALGSNYILKDGKRGIEADNLLFAIKNAKEACVGEIPRFEPKQNGSVASPMRSSRAVNPSLLPTTCSHWFYAAVILEVLASAIKLQQLVEDPNRPPQAG